MPDDSVLKRALSPDPDCEPLEVLSSNLELPPGSAARVSSENHLRDCPHCRTELDLLHEFESGVISKQEAESVRWIADRLKTKPSTRTAAQPKSRWWSPQVLVWAGSVAALAILTVGIALQRNHQSPQTQPVQEFDGEIQRDQSIQVLGDFNWKPVPGAAEYEVTIRLIDGSVIFHKTLTTPTLAFPDELARTVSTGKLLLWQVVARDSAGREIAQSGVQRTKLNR